MHTYAHTHTHTCHTHMCTQAYTNTSILSCTCTHRSTHICENTHTHAHTSTYPGAPHLPLGLASLSRKQAMGLVALRVWGHLQGLRASTGHPAALCGAARHPQVPAPARQGSCCLHADKDLRLLPTGAGGGQQWGQGRARGRWHRKGVAGVPWRPHQGAAGCRGGGPFPRAAQPYKPALGLS